MNLSQTDKATLKRLIREILIEDISLFKGVIKEILEENKVIGADAQAERRKKLEALIDEDFDEYDEVFNALA